MRNFYSKKASRVRRKKGTSSAFGLSFEALEDRRMLAAVTVSTAADLVDGNTSSIAALISSPGSDQAISLREAIDAANNTLATDTITFDANVFNGEAFDVIRLQSELQVFRSLEIDGGDLGIVVSGDSLGNDQTEAGSFITDVAASNAAGALSDNTNSVFAFLGANEAATISGLTITGGSSSERGGGILVDDASFSFTLNRSVVSGNRADESGGGIDFRGSQLTVDQSTISGNVVQSPRQDDFALGGGIATFGGDIVISNSTISGNTARGFTQLGLGGGIQVNSGSLSLISSTVSGNESSDTGGGVHSSSDSTVITDSTITDNTANFGGGINVISSRDVTFDLNNSIVAGNIAVSDNPDIVTGFVVSFAARSSLIGDEGGIARLSDFGGNQIGTANAPIDPQLGALADNGGLTKTHALFPTSPALGTGSMSLVFDQRGFPRLTATNPDIGAFEFQGDIFVVDTSEGVFDGNFSVGDLSLVEAIFLVRSTQDADAIIFDPTVFDGEADDVIHLQEGLFINQAVTIDAGDLDVVISGDRASNDILLAGTFITDVQNNLNFNDFDNLQPISIDTDLNDNVTLRGLTVTGGVNDFSSNDGGGIDSVDATLVIDNSVVAGNVANNGGGGGISVRNGSLTVSDSDISDNRAEDFWRGGGVNAINSEVSITESTVSGNFASQGGGIFSDTGAVTIVETTIRDNVANEIGGGIWTTDGDIIVDRSTVSGNVALSQDGGGIAAGAGSIIVSNSTISGNFAEVDGGAIKAFDDDVTITDSTVVGNRTNSGGAVSVLPGSGFFISSLRVTNSIISNNNAQRDIQFDQSQTNALLTVNSSLIGNNNGTFLSAAPVGFPDANGNIIGTFFDPIDPLLGELADNGGLTQTHALLPRSPAIDTGDTTSPTDQRGLPRPGSGTNGPDIGAFEDQSLTLIVDSSNDVVDGDFSTGNLTLREAIQQTNAFLGTDRILFDPQVFNGSPNDVIRLVNGELEITESVFIDAGDLQVVVSGDALGNDIVNPDTFIVDIASNSSSSFPDNSRVFNIATAAGESVILSGLTITGGNADEGGGGGIAVSLADVELNGVNLSGNRTNGDGGGILTDSQLTINDSIVSGNVIVGFVGSGGGIAAGAGLVSVNNSTISNNDVNGGDSRGGGVYVASGGIILTDSLVEGNEVGSVGSGGGIAADSNLVSLINSSVVGNSGGSFGGGIANQSGSVSLADSVVTGNSTRERGGGIYTETGLISISESTISGNLAASFGSSTDSFGGGLSTLSGDIFLTNTTVSDNESAFGGGISTDTGSVTLFETTINGNQSEGDGGGIHAVSGSISVTDSTISNNSALRRFSSGIGASGGGVYSDSGVVTVNSSTVSENSSLFLGGGLYAKSGEAIVTSSTFSGNSSAFGAGIYVSFADLSIRSSTVAFNESDEPGGIGGISNDAFTYGGSPTFVIHNSIIANNTTLGVASDLRSNTTRPVDLQFSLIGSNASSPLIAAPVGSPDANGNLIGTSAAVIDPLLDGLSNNGGLTQTHGLLGGSPAIDSGSSTLSNDQRGIPYVRAAGNAVDIGAYESQRLELLVDSTFDFVDGNFGAGQLSLREAILLANANPGEDLIQFDPDQFQGVTTLDTIFLRAGELTISESLQIDGEDLGIVISGDADSDDVTFFGTDITRPEFGGLASRDDNSSVLNIMAVAGELVTLTGLTITGGLGEFGGISNGAADLLIDRSTIAGNRSSSSGAGISNDSGTVTITRSTISGNETDRIGADGAGIHTVDGAISISLSTISGNHARQNGPSGGSGGGIASVNGDVLLDSVTLTENSAAGEGGGIFVADSLSNPSFTLINTIVAGNEALGSRPDLGFDPDGLVDIQFSLIGDSTGTSLVATSVGSPDADGNLIGNAAAVIDPLLGPLRDNFGPTLTHEVLTGSPAINAGNSPFVTDQRADPNFPRNDGGGVDIGSFERIVFHFVVDTASVVFDGDFSAGNLSLPEAVFLSNNNPSSDLIAFDSAVFDGGSEDVIRLQLPLIISDGVTIDAGDLGIVISGDTAGNDVLVAGSNVTDVFASQTNNTLNDNVQVINITATEGDVVAIHGLTITGGANTGFGSGIRNPNSDLELTKSVIVGNRSNFGGGGIHSEFGLLTLNESVVSGNFSNSFGGGGIFNAQGTVTLNNSSVTNNVTGFSNDGGGIFTQSGDVLLNNSTVSDNLVGRLGEGGGIFTNSGDVTLFNSSVNNNTTSDSGDGGGIHARFGDVTLTDSMVANNSTGENGAGGGIYTISSDVTLTNSTVVNNSTGENADGGGIHIISGDVTLTDSTVANNSTGENADGGGIYSNAADVMLTDSTVTNNTTGDGGDGGGIHTTGGGVTAIRTTISFNQSGGDGGGIESTFGELLFINSTISGNQSSGEGGGVNTRNTSSGNLIHLVNSTVTNNQSGGDGGGIHGTDSSFDTLTIENSILAGNTTMGGIGSDLEFGSNVETVIRFSLIGSNSGTPLSSTGPTLPDATGNLIGSPGSLIDPLLGGLADNGGPTLTHGLLSGSPAINAGGTTSIDVGPIDQRGVDRVQDGQIDIGATEGKISQLADVILSSSNFSPNFIDAIDGGGIGDGNGLGYSLVGDQQLTSVPWQNIDTLYLQFLTDVSASLEDGDILLTGTNGGDYSLGPITFDTNSLVATVPIVGGIDLDSLVISIFAGTVTDSGGDSVVGNNGDQFNFQFNVLPGDSDGSGQVTALDASNVFASNTDLSTAENARRDIDGSGQITAADAFAAFANNTNGLPVAPAAPIAPATITSAITSVASVTAIDAAFSEVLLEEPANEDVLVKTPVSAELPVKTPVDEIVFAETPVVNNVVFVETPASEEIIAQTPVNESIPLVLEPTQSNSATNSSEREPSLPTLVYNPQAVNSATNDRITRTFSNAPSHLNLGPELALAGHIEFGVAVETNRDYFAGKFQTTVEVDTNVIDAIFQANVLDELEFGSL